jgi:Protein of unknown function (DUF3108)
VKAVAIGLLAFLAALPAAAADGGLAPFVADYDVKYGRLSVGTSRTALSRDGDGWVMESTTNASGLYRVIASGTLRQHSEFVLLAEGPRPMSYLFDDGTRDTERDVSLQFDWQANRVRGIAEDRRVDIAAVAGLQDSASMQALVVANLRAGREPGVVAMIEKDKVKYYRYRFLRRETIKTAIGDVETVVYRSARDGSDRETITWFAPKLGFAAVQAEQLTGGKRGFQTYIRRFQGDVHLESGVAPK